MIKRHLKSGTPIYYASDWIESVCYNYDEHYGDSADVFCINIGVEDLTNIRKENFGNRIVLVNLEHKFPIDEHGQLKYCNEYWTNVYNDIVREIYDEVWDFQIENYAYYKFHKIENKFRFRPLRHTTWFDKYKNECEAKYDIQMECVFDTNTRLWVANTLTQQPYTVQNDIIYKADRITLNITNTDRSDEKFKAKNECRYGFDSPHYDTPCTNNCTRIYEYVCMNKPVIVWDRDKNTSRMYFRDLCTYIEDFNAWNVKLAVSQPPRKDIDDTFRQMTSSDKDYLEYCQNIIRDHCDRTGEQVPDSVMY